MIPVFQMELSVYEQRGADTEMRLIEEIPEGFFGLFRSVNRELYIEALLRINEEYEYNSYFLSREVCIQILNDCFSRKKTVLEKEELENEADLQESPATRILNWLVKTGWLKKLDDYYSMTTNIIIPDYSAVFIEAFVRLYEEDMDETEVYIQNIYAILFSFRNDKRAGIGLLNTALINTRRLNKALQDMLHNMDKFFTSLLEKQFYGELLKEHLEGYVEDIVKKKYHLLKTSDNFYLYKTDIKRWIKEMREDESWLEDMGIRSGGFMDEADIMRKLDQMERGFDEIERRISNMDREHTKYVRATVSRLNYLLSSEDDTRGLVIQLLNHLSASPQQNEDLARIGGCMNLSRTELISASSLYKRRKARNQPQEEDSENDVAEEELTKEDILKLNRIGNRYSKQDIENFILKHMEEGRAVMSENQVKSDGEFEKLILAYDYAVRKNSEYQVLYEDGEMVDNGFYLYPRLTFVKKAARTQPGADNTGRI